MTIDLNGNCRTASLISALIYMMTLYQRTQCPRLASAIAAHLDSLSQQRDAQSVIHETADAICDYWHILGAQPSVVPPAPRPMMLN